MIEELLPTKTPQKIIKVTAIVIPAFWFIIDIVLPLMPYKLDANLVLIKLLLCLILLCISLFLIIISLVNSYKQLLDESADADFNKFIKNPIKSESY